MSIFGDLVNTATGATGATGASTPAGLGHPGLVNALLGLLGNRQTGGVGGAGGGGGVGGLGGLVQLFEQQGLGHLINSWIGTGQNLPVTGQQLESVLGHGRLASLAQEAGIPPEQASSMLASVLPSLVDHLTPNGTTDHGLLEEGINVLRGKMS
jgi:uncharacterized protein YidB (DUF937 family)